ncbi:MAG: hypothetical protein Q6361_04190 [Candidatus Hermodarchaeota archaeon]|nr:hypothetical protein [Candidatus Hermodarchaeota archaeon]
MKSKTVLACALVLILVGAFFFVFLPQYGLSNMTITWYDKDGAKVGTTNLGSMPFAPVLVQNQEVTSFTLSVSYYTDHPEATHASWAIDIRVWYISGDSVPPQEIVVFDDLCWLPTLPYEVVPGSETTATSAPYFISAYAETGVPEDTPFYIEFSGYAKFFDAVPPNGRELARIDFAPLRIACYHSSYEFTASINPW